MRIEYNAPVTLTFSLIALCAFILGQLSPGITSGLFTLQPHFAPTDPLSYLRPVTYVFGHSGAAHLIGNLSFILLLGPALEEKYGSRTILVLILITTLLTALVFLLFYSNGLLGASGVVFMFIILNSFTRVKADHIPLTFVLVCLIFLGKEVLDSFSNDQISQTAHILGGVCGGAFGFRLTKQARKPV